MEKLTEYEFGNRPSRGQFAFIVPALKEPGVQAVKLTRGPDFGADVKMSSVQSAVRAEINKAGLRARTEIISDNEIVVGLSAEAAPRRRRRARELVTA